MQWGSPRPPPGLPPAPPFPAVPFLPPRCALFPSSPSFPLFAISLPVSDAYAGSIQTQQWDLPELFPKSRPGDGGAGWGRGGGINCNQLRVGMEQRGSGGQSPGCGTMGVRPERERENRNIWGNVEPRGGGGGGRTRAARPPSGNSARGGPPWGPQWGHRLSPGGSVRWHPALPPRAQRGGGAQHRAHLRLSEPPGHVRTPQPRAGVRSAELCARPPTCPRRSPSRGDSRAVRVCLAGGGSVAPLRAAAWHTARLLLFSCFFFFFFFYL